MIVSLKTETWSLTARLLSENSQLNKLIAFRDVSGWLLGIGFFFRGHSPRNLCVSSNLPHIFQSYFSKNMAKITTRYSFLLPNNTRIDGSGE